MILSVGLRQVVESLASEKGLKKWSFVQLLQGTARGSLEDPQSLESQDITVCSR